MARCACEESDEYIVNPAFQSNYYRWRWILCGARPGVCEGRGLVCVFTGLGRISICMCNSAWKTGITRGVFCINGMLLVPQLIKSRCLRPWRDLDTATSRCTNTFLNGNLVLPYWLSGTSSLVRDCSYGWLSIFWRAVKVTGRCCNFGHDSPTGSHRKITLVTDGSRVWFSSAFEHYPKVSPEGFCGIHENGSESVKFWNCNKSGHVQACCNSLDHEEELSIGRVKNETEKSNDCKSCF